MFDYSWGMQIGAEVTDVLLILSTPAAVEAFKSRAQISVGAELGVSVGPLGRSIASDVTAGTKGAAHAFSYAHSKGLFFGVSLEASGYLTLSSSFFIHLIIHLGIASRPDVNTAFYGEKVSTSILLSGDYPRPKAADNLYHSLNTIADDFLSHARPEISQSQSQLLSPNQSQTLSPNQSQSFKSNNQKQSNNDQMNVPNPYGGNDSATDRLFPKPQPPKQNNKSKSLNNNNYNYNQTQSQKQEQKFQQQQQAQQISFIHETNDFEEEGHYI